MRNAIRMSKESGWRNQFTGSQEWQITKHTTHSTLQIHLQSALLRAAVSTSEGEVAF